MNAPVSLSVHLPSTLDSVDEPHATNTITARPNIVRTAVRMFSTPSFIDDQEIAQRFAPASSSVGSPSGFSPASFSPTIVEKFGGVAGMRDVIRSMKESSDWSHCDSHCSTSPILAWMATPSNGTGCRRVRRQYQDLAVVTLSTD